MVFIYIFLAFFSCKDKEVSKVNNVVHVEDTKYYSPNNEEYTTKIGLINDPDGYTNVRLKPDSESLVVGTISKNEYFFYTISNSNWYSVKTLKGLKGYVHKSRINNANNNKQICATINSIDPSDSSYDKDTIVNINSLNKKTPFLIKELIYPRLNQQEKSDNTILFSEEDIKIEISKNEFNLDDYNVVNDGGNLSVKTKEGDGVYGGYANPKYIIQSIVITLYKEVFNISSKEFYNLLDPSFEKVIVYKKSNKQIIISMTGADNNASENYNVLFVLDKGELLKKYVYLGF